MEISDVCNNGAKSSSDQELGFDFLSKQRVVDSGGVGPGVIEHSFFNNRASEGADDGFLTPISVDRKIKIIETCPPAPRKPPPPPPSRKRKALFPVDQSEIVAEIAKSSPAKKARVLTAPVK